MHQSSLGVLVSVLSFLSPVNGQEGWQNVRLIGKMTPPMSGSVDVKVLSNGEDHTCYTSSKPADALCSAQVPLATTSARIEIHARGYKVYAINIPRLVFNHDVATVDIGTISLTKSELPTVEQIVEAESQGGNQKVFELTLQNKLPRDVLITNLRVRGFHPGADVSCCCPPSAIFEISDVLHVVGGGNGTFSAQGKYQEKTHGDDHVVTVNSQIEKSGCGGATSLELNLPVSFVIPKASYSAIQILLPEHFAVQNSHYSRDDIKERPQISPDIGRVDHFQKFEFSLSTGDKDELTIEAVYPSAQLER